jgi:hypothetical protein
MRTQAMLKPDADLLEFMRADRQVQNKRQAEQAAVDLKAARESILAIRIERVAPRGDAGPLVDSWVRAGRPLRGSGLSRQAAQIRRRKEKPSDRSAIDGTCYDKSAIR